MKALEMAVPEGTVAVIILSRTEDGSLQASYAEVRGQVPATRTRVTDVLLRLAAALDDQRRELDAAENGANR